MTANLSLCLSSDIIDKNTHVESALSLKDGGGHTTLYLLFRLSHFFAIW